MSATKFSFVAKLFGQMKEMSIKEINGGTENIRREKKTNCRPPVLRRRGRDGFLPPSTANYCHILNLWMKNLGRKSFPVLIQKQRKTRDGCVYGTTHWAIRRGNLAGALGRTR